MPRRAPARNAAGLLAAENGPDMKRDSATIEQLRELGWSVAVVWECELKAQNVLPVEVQSFLQNPPSDTALSSQ
jgi:G:T-mismatch repair DNA endonuclease (very short patch repair protein)